MNITPEMARAELARRQLSKSNITPRMAQDELIRRQKFQIQEPSMDEIEKPKGFLNNALDYEKALGLGLAQGAGDVGASIGNFPADIYQHFTGNQPYHIPHPHLQQFYPEGTAGKIGSSIGETIGNVAIPGMGPAKAIGAFSGPLSRILAGGLAGGLSGAASNEEDRIGSGLTGAAIGSGAPALGSVIKGISNVPFTKKMAAKPLELAKQLVKERELKEISVPKNLLTEAKDFLPKNLPTKNLLKEALKGDYDKLFTLQSDLGKSAHQLTKSASGAERLHGFQANDLRQRLLDAMKKHLSERGHGDISELMSKGQKRYAQHMKIVSPIKKHATKLLVGSIGAKGAYDILKH